MKQYIRLFREAILDNNTGGNTDSNTPIDYKNLHELSRLLYDKGFVDGLANPTEVNDTIKSFLSSPSKPISEEELDKIAEEQYPFEREQAKWYQESNLEWRHTQSCKRTGLKQGYRLHVSKESELRQGIDMLVKHKDGEIKKLTEENERLSKSEDQQRCNSHAKDQRIRELEDALRSVKWILDNQKPIHGFEADYEKIDKVIQSLTTNK